MILLVVPVWLFWSEFEMLGTETPLLILFIAISSSLLHFHSPPWCDRMAVNFDNSWSMTSVELELLVQEPCFCRLSSCSPLSWTPPSFFPDTSHFAVAKFLDGIKKPGMFQTSIFLRKPSYSTMPFMRNSTWYVHAQFRPSTSRQLLGTEVHLLRFGALNPGKLFYACISDSFIQGCRVPPVPPTASCMHPVLVRWWRNWNCNHQMILPSCLHLHPSTVLSIVCVLRKIGGVRYREEEVGGSGVQHSY